MEAMDLNSMLAGAGLVVAVMVPIWRMFSHYDAKNETRFEKLDKKNAERIDRLDAKNEQRIDRLDAKNEQRIDRLDAKNEQAHAAITENIKAVDARAEARAEAHRAALEAIAHDVSFLAGRQAERDRSPQ